MMATSKHEGVLGGGKSLTLFECSVPEQDCNIHLGSRRKSKGALLERSEKDEIDRESLPVSIISTALSIMQTGMHFFQI